MPWGEAIVGARREPWARMALHIGHGRALLDREPPEPEPDSLVALLLWDIATHDPDIARMLALSRWTRSVTQAAVDKGSALARAMHAAAQPQ